MAKKKKIKKEETKGAGVTVKKSDQGVTGGKAGASVEFKINLGDYENTRQTIWTELPTGFTQDDLDASLKDADRILDGLNERITEFLDRSGYAVGRHPDADGDKDEEIEEEDNEKDEEEKEEDEEEGEDEKDEEEEEGEGEDPAAEVRGMDAEELNKEYKGSEIRPIAKACGIETKNVNKEGLITALLEYMEENPADEEEDDDGEDEAEDCVACEGTGKDSKGKKCPICKGTGKKPASDDEEEEDEEEEEEEGEDDEEEKDEFDGMTRKQLLKHNKENELGIKSTKKLSDDELRDAIREAASDEEEEDDEDERRKELEGMKIAEVKKIAVEHDIKTKAGGKSKKTADLIEEILEEEFEEDDDGDSGGEDDMVEV